MIWYVSDRLVRDAYPGTRRHPMCSPARLPPGSGGSAYAIVPKPIVYAIIAREH